MTNPFTWWRDWWRGLEMMEKLVAVAVLVFSIIIIFISTAQAQENSAAVNTQAVWIALIVAMSSTVVSPVLLSFLTNRNRHAEREEDRADRQAVVDQAKEAAELLRASTKAQAKVAEEQKYQLKEIHTLVNSNLTAAKQAQLEATEAKLVLLREIAVMRKGKPTVEQLADIETTVSKIAELKAELDDRLAQTAKVEELQKTMLK